MCRLQFFTKHHSLVISHRFSLPHMCTLHQQLARRSPVCAMTSCPSAVSASSAPLSSAMSVLSPTFLPQSGLADLWSGIWCYSVAAQLVQELHFTIQWVETHDFCTGISSSWEVMLPHVSLFNTTSKSHWPKFWTSCQTVCGSSFTQQKICCFSSM